MVMKRFIMILLGLTLSTGLMSTNNKAHASSGMGDVMAIALGTAILVGGANLTTIISSSVYLAKEKEAPLGWQIFNYTISGLTFGTGTVMTVASAVNGYSDAVGLTMLGVGATGLTLAILSATLNKGKTPDVAISPILLRDVEGNLTPGVGLSLGSF